MPPAHRGPTGAPTAIASGFNAAMALGPQPKIVGSSIPNSSYADVLSDDEDEDDNDDDSHGSPAATSHGKGKGKASTTSAKKGTAGARGRAATTLEHRKEQNRAAQREFRQRKQQYIRALEARVELLSSEHDTQVDRLRFALRQLLAENNTLRAIVASLASFIGKGAIDGCMAEAGLTREELEDAMHNCSEKTMTEAWQNWPGAKECEALMQIRMDSNIPIDGLPESKLPWGCSTSGRQKQTSQPALPDAPEGVGQSRSANNDPQQQQDVASGEVKAPAASDTRKRKKGADNQDETTPTTRRKGSGQAIATATQLNDIGAGAVDGQQTNRRPQQQQQHRQQQPQEQSTASSTNVMGPSAVRDSPARRSTEASPGAAPTPNTAAFTTSAQKDAFLSNRIFASPEMWQQQQQQMENLYMLQQQSPTNGPDVTFLQTLFGDLDTQNGVNGVSYVPAAPGNPSMDFASPFELMGSLQMMSEGSSNGGQGFDGGSMKFSAAHGATPTSTAASNTVKQQAAQLPQMTRSNSTTDIASRRAVGPALTLAQGNSGRGNHHQQQQQHQHQLTAIVTNLDAMSKRIVRLMAALNRTLQKRGFIEFLDLGRKFELQPDDMRYVEELERGRPFLILAHHGFEGDLQSDFETRDPDGPARHRVLTRRQIERMEEAFTQLMYHFHNLRINPTYRLPKILQPSPIQLTHPHDHDIDVIPWATVRDALILYPQLDVDEVVFEALRSAEIHDGDILMENMWDIHRPFFVKFPMMAQEKLLRISNNWRTKRGQTPMTVDALWEDHEKFKVAEQKKWKELGEPFPLPERHYREPGLPTRRA